MKIYLFAVAGTLIMSYLNELLMYLMFRGEVSFQAGTFTLRGLGEIFGMTILGVLASVEMFGEELGWLGWLFPAAVVHAVTNLLPALVAYSDSFYQAHIVPMNGAGRRKKNGKNGA